MKIRIEISSLATQHQSGVASYTRLLSDALADSTKNTVRGHYFNFLRRQQQPQLGSNEVMREQNLFVPLRVYAKLQSHGIAPAFDIFLPRVDLTIFPNFATWPTAKSTLTATTIHDLTYLYHPECVEEKNLHHLRRVVPRSIRTADIVLTVSHTVKDEIVKEFDVDPDKIVVTTVPPEDIFKKRCSDGDISRVRSKYSIGEQKFILFLGNFEPRKNLATLVAAYRLLPAAVRREYKLILAGGKGWNSQATQQALDEAIQAGENISHIGYIDSEDRPILYQGASLFVFPSLYEGFGIPILEAQYGGCPVVAADIPVLRETGGDSVLYANPASPQDFAKVIEQALDAYPYDKQAMLDNAGRFSWDKNVEALLNRANELLGHTS